MKRTLQLLALVLIFSYNSFSQNQWKWLNPKPSGFTGVDIHFISHDTGYIVNQEEILITTDCGNEWKKLREISSSNDIDFYNSLGLIVGNNGYVLKSINYGMNWNQINIGVTDNFNTINFINEDTILISSQRELIKSYDGGNTWHSIEISNYYINSISFINSNLGFAACNNGKIVKTIDGGLTWTLCHQHDWTSWDINVILFLNKEIGFAFCEVGDILKTENGGQSWKKVVEFGQGYNTAFFIDDSIGFAGGEDGYLLKTTDGGENWANSGFGGLIDSHDILSTFFVNDSIGFTVGLRGRIMKTSNGGDTWIAYSPTYYDIKQIEFTSDNVGYALVGNSFIKTLDGGNLWAHIGTPVDNVKTANFDFINNEIGYAIVGGEEGTSGNSGSIYKTSNGGQTWNKTHESYEILYEDLYSIEFINEDTGFVSGGYNSDSFFKTTDGGRNWTILGSYSFGQMQFLNSQIGYATNTYNYYRRIYKTVDGGLNWNIVFELTDDINSFHFVTENIGYLVGEYGITYNTNDGGNTWQELNPNNIDYKVVKFYTQNIGYISGESNYKIHIYKTIDGGYTWQEENIPNISAPIGLTSISFTNNKNIYISGANGIILKDTITYDSISIRVNPVIEYTDDNAMLSGIVASNEDNIENIKFEYGTNFSFDKTVNATPNIIYSSTADSVEAYVANLEANTKYYYRLKVTYNGIEYASNPLIFKTLPEIEISMPYVYSYSSNEADLAGNIVSYEGDVTEIEFQYGTDTSFTKSIEASPNMVFGNANQDISGKLTLLEPETKYYARIKAVYKGVEKYSPIISFTTQPDYKINLYSPYINNTNVTLNAYISAYKDTMENIVFEYGKTRYYSSFVEASPNQINKNSSGFIEAYLTGLDTNSIYYYRLKANLGFETIYSDENILQISGGVIIVPIDIRQISDSSILLQGLINTNGKYIYGILFEYGISENFGDSIYAYPSYIYDRQTHTVQSNLDSLVPHAKYYFRIKATDGQNIYYSDTFSFTLGEPNGLDKTKDFTSVIVFPNPTNCYFMIKSHESIRKIEFIDSKGKTLFIKNNEEFFDISGYPTGLYFIKIYTNNKQIIRRIIKN
jgi:photosystem II stability/assembly factor-like uncharacterized protein